jgi:2-hydroxy-6-oxonona-2,4-dienedioate hydrolase
LEPDAGTVIGALEDRSVATIFSTDAGEMVWRRWGAGPPLILVHGGGGSWQHWIRNIDALAEHREVWCPDLLGFGDSAAPNGPEPLAAVVLGLAAGISRIAGDEKVALCGFSFGGIAASLAVAAKPLCVDRLVLVGATGLGVDVPDVHLEPWRGVEDSAELERLHRVNLRQLMLAGETDRICEFIYSSNLRRVRFHSARYAASALVPEALRATAVPLFGIWGSLDATVSGPAEAEAALRRSGNLVGFDAIPGAGHWVQFEAPELFNASLLRALAK